MSKEIINMTNEQIEGGKLIAEFMGEKISTSGIGIVRPAGWDDLFKYHSSWDWLKPVIEKIGNIEFNSIDGFKEYMRDNFSESKIHIYQKIDIVYPAVVEFVKWYNEAIKQEVKKRENGFYWVSKTGYDWKVAEYKDRNWSVIGSNNRYSDYDFINTEKYTIREVRIKDNG